MTHVLDIAAVVEALRLPPGTRVDTRVPKKLLIEQGAPTAADKRAIQEGIDELQWFAACKPATIGTPAFKDDVREYLEVAVIGCAFRPEAKVPRLIELIHRAIPYPVLLIGAGSDGVVVSAFHKRNALNEKGRVVLDHGGRTGPLTGVDVAVEEAFLESLMLARQPRRDLFWLYEGWVSRIEALNAARLTGAFAATDNREAVEQRRRALDQHSRLTREIASLRAKATREKQLNRRVDLNLEIQRLEADLEASKRHL